MACKENTSTVLSKFNLPPTTIPVLRGHTTETIYQKKYYYSLFSIISSQIVRYNINTMH